MIFIKIGLFIIGILLIIFGIYKNNNYEEELGKPIFGLGIGTIIIAILLCFNLYLIAKIILSILAVLLLIYGISMIADSNGGIGILCIVTAILMVGGAICWFTNCFGFLDKKVNSSNIVKVQNETTTKEQVDKTITLVITEDANVRKQPDKNSSIIDVVKANSKLRGTLSSANDNWYEVRIKDETGYIHKSLVKEKIEITKDSSIIDYIGEHPFITLLIFFSILFCAMKFVLLNCIFGVLVNVIAIIAYIFIFIEIKHNGIKDIAIYVAFVDFFVLLMGMGAEGVKDGREVVTVWDTPTRYITPHFVEVVQNSHEEERGWGPIVHFFGSIIICAVICAIIGWLLNLVLNKSVTWGIIIIAIGIIVSIREIIRYVMSTIEIFN